MAKFYIMSGLPFSGKTTLAKEIAKKLGASYISFDQLWVDHETELPEDKIEGWYIIRDLAKSQIGEFLKNSMSVVYDDTNVGADHRAEFREVASQAGGEAVVVYADTPQEIRLQRMQDNLETQQRHDVEVENIKKAEADFDEPQVSEGTVTYRPDEDLQGWLGKLS